MNRYKLLFFFLSCLIVYSTNGMADEVRQSMDRAYVAYKGLQQYLHSRASFEKSSNKEGISDLLRSLRDDFHKVEGLNSKFRDEPGFVKNLEQISSTLDDVTKRFGEGKVDYARWRLGHVSQACITCHTTYNVELRYRDDDVKDLNQIEKANFYLATRQPERAEAALLAASKDLKNSERSMEIARKLLVLYTRLKSDPKDAIKQIEGFKRKAILSNDEREEINEWIQSLRRWADGPGLRDLSIAETEALIRKAVNAKDIFSDHADAVSLLKATLSLHSSLKQKTLTPTERSNALYLLGYAYSKLPLFFMDQFSEFYLEECIEEYPGTDNAVRAFKVYKQIILLEYTGSGGTSLPGDVATKLLELHDKAYGSLTIAEKS